VDVLSDAIEALALRAEIRMRLELTAPWGFDGDGGGAPFYAVTRGSCWLEVHGSGAPLQLMPGDFALLPHGGTHVLRDSRLTRAVPFDELLTTVSEDGILRGGGGGPLTALAAGTFTVADDGRDPLVAALPAVIHLARDGSSPRVDAALQLLAAELVAPQPAGDAAARRIAEVLFAFAVRAQLGLAEGWLRAVADPLIGRAMAFMHTAPHDPWTIESLASRLGISRASFAARFTALVGEPPLTYLTRHRMRRAAKQLRGTAAPIGEIARAAGYESEAAFNTAFKRTIGVAPGRYRRGIDESPSRAEKPRRPRVRRQRSAQPESAKRRDWWFID
jgi:AraC-like DNA-binding protein